MMNLKRIVYFGTAPIAVPALEALVRRPEVTVVAVCTQPDRPSGRNRRQTPSPVKQTAAARGLRVLDPERIGDAEAALRELAPDLGVVFAYGQYLPRRIFDLPARGSINFHPSMLPKYRGASPIQSAIRDGCRESGLSVIRVGEKMDAGEVLLQVPVAVGMEDTSATLTARFADLAARLVPEVLDGLREETLTFTPQDEAGVTECGKIGKADGGVDWTLSAEEIRNRVRAFQPWPGVFFPLGAQGNVKILEAAVESGAGRPGEVLAAEGGAPRVACGKDVLRLCRVQPPGKKPMDGAAFLNGHPLPPGTVLDSAEPGA